VPRLLAVNFRAPQPTGPPRFEEREGELVAALIEELAFLTSARSEANGPDAPVALARIDHDEPVLLERPQQPAHIAGVETEPCPEVAYIALSQRTNPAASTGSRDPRH
jgi:hypothetical protein